MTDEIVTKTSEEDVEQMLLRAIMMWDELDTYTGDATVSEAFTFSDGSLGRDDRRGILLRLDDGTEFEITVMRRRR